MGINGLLPLLKSIHRPTELRKYAGETLGIDGYGWLHRGAIACAIDLAQGKPTRKYVDYAMHRVKMFKHFGVTPYVVFDGDYLPSKAKTELDRDNRREASRRTGLELLKAGKPSQAHIELQKAIDITPEMARHLIDELKKADVPYVVAPYEADAQLIYLERQGIISGVVSEDSDLLVFGAKRLLTKMDQYGQCIEINRSQFCAVREISLTGWTDAEFRHMAIFSGCDYLDSLPSMGLKTAYRMIRKLKTPERIVKKLQFDGKIRVPDDYLERFKQAELTFIYQRVFCPVKQAVVCLTEPDESINVDDMPYIGAPIDAKLARAIAAGDVNPITKDRITVTAASPSKRRISQVFSSAYGEGKKMGKPIDQYFKDRRIPLGEMDPNCFHVEPDNGEQQATTEPRPIVFPLPRPYVDEVGTSATPSRRYVAQNSRRKSEPISKLLASFDDTASVTSRRQTTGAGFEIFTDTDPAISTRPPKKARLCEDALSEDAVTATPEKSKFFPQSKAKKTAARKSESFIMSDDSVEEAFRSVPDAVWSSSKARRRSGKVQFVEESPSSEPVSQEKEHEEVEEPTLPVMPVATLDATSDTKDEVEVPGSSPQEDVIKKTVKTQTPLGPRLRQFSYQPGKAGARIVNERPAAVRRSSLNPSSPMLTPLQRMGARALKQVTPRATPPSSIRARKASKPRESLGSLSVDPAAIPLPLVDLAEVRALNMPLQGSEDQIIPESDGETELSTTATRPRLNLSQFLYS
ncbi:hypothetical protein SMACR_06425 [Sordaria macrospora]|uniref:Exonuclease 1 n=2 Tax=Sordaria macrospora TaxID=5147 RepID=A0A8S8ZHM7_SORMA|nr:putative EXO1 protein [Sordaria macrospora k-hell]KAA8627852.1 hypothetical protein SMACR_06425 [Sordaria macrospora]WPJ65740.1 hypothetical protein SMAC4_06425 [Sordaria macrospora]CCC13206.1 putative EXO1 protein [Sordaria macrospora k-hell]